MAVPPKYVHNSRCITPKMTSNTTPSPVVISTNSNYGDGSGYEPWRAFDQTGVAGSGSNGWSAIAATSGRYIQVDLGAGNFESISGYTITQPSDGYTIFPVSFTIYGGVTGADTVIDQQSGIRDPVPYEMVTFTLPQPTPRFRYFMLYVTGVQTESVGNPVYVGEIEFLRSTTGTYNHLTPRGRARPLMYPTFRR